MTRATQGNRPVTAAVVLAAGAGTRFGSQKMLAELRGRPVLWHALDALRDLAIEARYVVVGAEAERVAASVEKWCLAADLPPAFFSVLKNPFWREGMATSLHAAAGIDCDWILVVLGDQPFVGTAHLRTLLDARSLVLSQDTPLDAVASCYENRVAVPALLSASLAPQLLALRGDTGARKILSVLEGEGRIRTVPLLHAERYVDIDTREDLAILQT